MYVRNQLDTFIRIYKSADKEKDQLYIVMKVLKKVLQATKPKDEFVKLKEKLEKDFSKSANTIFLSFHLWATAQITNQSFVQLSKEVAKKELAASQ